MNKITPGRVIARKDLELTHTKEEIAKLYNTLQIFPTPFEAIYYVPFETERKGFYITDPYRVLFEAAQKYLKNKDIYFGLSTAEYYHKTVWNPPPAHIINANKSRTITLPKKREKTYWRKQKRYEILAQYPHPIYIHRMKNRNPQLRKKGVVIYSTKLQTKKDLKYLENKGIRYARA